MDSKNLNEFFYSLTPEKILSAVETTGHIATGRLLQLGSFENRVYEVEVELDATPKTPAEKFRVIKFYRPGRWTKEQIEEEHRFLKELQEEEISVVAPVVLKSGSTIGVLPHTEETFMYYSVFPKVQGRRPEDLTDQDMRVMGRLVARMHRVGKRSEARNRKILNENTFGLESLEILRNGKHIPPVIQERYASMVEDFCKKIHPLFQSTPNQRIHGDCHLGNVLQGQGGFFFLDFDDMVTGPVVQDMWLLCGGRDEEGLRHRDNFLTGYEEFADFDMNFLRLIEPLRGLRYIHYNAWIARRWEDPIFPRTFPHFKAQDYWVNQLQDLAEVMENF